jgi:hypothetical protein
MNIIKIILNKAFRFITYIPFALILCMLWLILLPIILVFHWNFIWLLLIAHEENCALEEAKILMATVSKYKFNRWNNRFPNEQHPGKNTADLDDDMTSIDTSHITSPAHYYNPGNIYHYR